MKSFSTRTYGKWILCGEHSVLRGCPALVFPLLSRSMELSWQETSQPLEIAMKGEHGEELQLLFWGVLEKACELKKIKRSALVGKIELQSRLPVGAGLGASAAFCVAMTKWFQYLGFVSESEAYEFARQLENLFHGESSGVDIAVAMNAQGLHFERNGERKALITKWQPQWYISYSGKRGVTADCVHKVKQIIQQNPELGQKIDQQMRTAVELSEQALLLNEQQGLAKLIEAMDIATHCFEQWGLTQGAPEAHMNWLKDQGAIAIKPTGSGGGGYVLSLWQKQPPQGILDRLISCWA